MICMLLFRWSCFWSHSPSSTQKHASYFHLLCVSVAYPHTAAPNTQHNASRSGEATHIHTFCRVRSSFGPLCNAAPAPSKTGRGPDSKQASSLLSSSLQKKSQSSCHIPPPTHAPDIMLRRCQFTPSIHTSIYQKRNHSHVLHSIPPTASTLHLRSVPQSSSQKNKFDP